MRVPLIAGNWKMHKTLSEALAFVRYFTQNPPGENVEALICAPAPLLHPLSQAMKTTPIALGAQNMHHEVQGAFTGEISAAMIKDAGASYVIIGHSERRQLFNETDTSVNQKVTQALREGIAPILCCGETLSEREESRTKMIIRDQITKGLVDISKEGIARVVIAYEPIWAIGTGKTASNSDANEVCADIRCLIGELYGPDAAAAIRILYGGSVNTKTINGLMAESDIDGALVGGASLDAISFHGLTAI